jgi:hypothetical protein
MKKCLFNNLKDGGSYQLRTSNFKPIESLKVVPLIYLGSSRNLNNNKQT